MSVQEYIDKHELTKLVEDAVNATVKALPNEPLSFLVRIVDQHTCILTIRFDQNRRCSVSELIMPTALPAPRMHERSLIAAEVWPPISR